MKENKVRQKVVLAAILHDIGKFWERTTNQSIESKVITDEFPNKQYNHVVPLYENNSPKYTHALWTQAFFTKYNIGKLLDLDIEGEENLATLSARHHKPSNHLEGIISLADKWSSSIDRPDEGEEDVSGYAQVKEKWDKGFSKKVPLFSIFNQIQVGKDKNKSEKQTAYSMSKLNVLDQVTLFGKITIPDKSANLCQAYSDLWIQFESEMDELIKRHTEFDSFFVSLCDILRKYTWCIPSATNVEPCNVSLFEHLKTTAGLALSIYDYYDFHKKEINYTGHKYDQDTKDEDTLLMLCIDISGIQKFIYDIANKKAAKSLKGRSFYLQLLMNNILDQILEHKDIVAYSTNIIYASGGKAYLILPNLDRIKNAITAIDQNVQEYLWEEYEGKIYAVFGHVAFNYQTLRDEVDGKWKNYVDSNDLTVKERTILKIDHQTKIDLGQLWRIVSDRAAAQKNQKFKQKILNNYNQFFNPISYDNEHGRCQVTGKRSHNLKDLNDERDTDPEKKLMVLKSVYDQTKLGQGLKNSAYLVEYKNADAEIKEDVSILETKYQLRDHEFLLNKLKVGHYEKARVNVLNATEYKLNLNNTGVRTLFYGGNNQPIKVDGDFKTFEDLAKSDDGKNTKLAILRMDVDNLGQIFIDGFDDRVQKKSFAAYSTLSFMLEAFFCGHINYIHQQEDKNYKDYVQILYSGGDDLFAVGRWDAIIDFAAEIRTKFEQFVGRPDITISAGIAIIGSKYPIMKSAELAGEAEKVAKYFNEKAKNAINFFGETVSWGPEFEIVRSLKNQFIYFDGPVNKSILHQLQNYKLIKDSGIKDKSYDLSYKWHSAYSLSRTLERLDEKKNQESYSFVDMIRKKILHDEQFGADRYLDLVALAARWAEYSLKFKNK